MADIAELVGSEEETARRLEARVDISLPLARILPTRRREESWRILTFLSDKFATDDRPAPLV